MKFKKGFTIIEVFLASIILVMTLVGGIVFISANRKNLVYATRQRLATWSAIYKMEDLKSLAYPSIVSGTENITVSGVSLQRSTTVEEIDEDGGGADYKKVIVEVNWGQGNISLATYVAPK